MTSLYEEKNMQFLIGVLSTLCAVMGIALWWMNSSVKKTLKGIYLEYRQLNNAILTMPKSVQNIIHLGLKEGRMTTGLVPATLSIRPEDFQVRADKLYANFVHNLGTSKLHEGGTRAFVILNHAGFDEMVDGQSRREAQSALTRLLNNDDDEATKRFLRTLADSVNQTQVESETAVH